jgi:hypothetical protein
MNRDERSAKAIEGVYKLLGEHHTEHSTVAAVALKRAMERCIEEETKRREQVGKPKGETP